MNTAEQVNFSIIVPVLNEMEILAELLSHLNALKSSSCEIIIVDGGSQDGTLEKITASGLNVIKCPAGRARQMNAGASAAKGDLLIFLHADTRLPENALQIIAQHCADSEFQWGRFNVVIDGKSPFLKVVATMMNWRSRISGIATGDQAIFVRRKIFQQVAGFPEQPLMEDIELCKRLKRQFPPVCLTECVHTSGRRWEQRGLWRTIFLMWRCRWNYWRGVPAEKIAAAYR